MSRPNGVFLFPHPAHRDKDDAKVVRFHEEFGIKARLPRLMIHKMEEFLIQIVRYTAKKVVIYEAVRCHWNYSILAVMNHQALRASKF